MDILTPEQRSVQMAKIRSKDTKIELTVRRLIHGMGYRFRLHRKDLPGKPDLVFCARKKVIFVHGCFWHGHDCPRFRLPKSNAEYWIEKISSNIARDSVHVEALSNLGWQSLVIWECELKPVKKLEQKIRNFLDEGQQVEKIHVS